MGSRDPRVDAYIAGAMPFARPILTYIRKVVHAGCPGVEEGMKWSFPHFMSDGILCSMAAFQKHCAFGFWKGALLNNGKRTPQSRGPMGQYGRITKITDLPRPKEFTALVRKAAALNAAGVKVPRRAPAMKPAVKTPADLMKALRANTKALDAFKAFSPSHKREYITWITEAKTDETRQRRVMTAVDWIEHGKSRHWMYARKP